MKSLARRQIAAQSLPFLARAGALALWVLFGGLLTTFSLEAEEHRATRLGDPATRFAPPLVTSEDVRARFRDQKLRPDFAHVLKLWGWEGDLDDFFNAGLTAEISEIKIPVGTKMVFMSTRRNHEAIPLRNVIWAGKEPVGAFSFDFISKHRRYRCIIPKPCSNFFVEDQGEALADLQLVLSSPPQSSLCTGIPITVAITNTGNIPLSKVRLSSTLPNGLLTSDNQVEPVWNLGTIPPGEGRQLSMTINAQTAGRYAIPVRAQSAESTNIDAGTTIEVQAPVLAIDCRLPREIPQGRSTKLCLVVTNLSDISEPSAMVNLTIPEGANLNDIPAETILEGHQLRWNVGALNGHASRELCLVLNQADQGSATFTSMVTGSCSKPAMTSCSTKIIGIPAVLLEVIDTVDPILVGESTTYEIRVLNQGFGPLTNIHVVCRLPKSQQFVSGEGINAVTQADNVVTMEVIPVLEPKTTASWKIVIKAIAEDDARFRVELVSDQFQKPILEDESTRQY
jgi:hypothetical protein